MFLTNNSSICDLSVVGMSVFLSLYGSQPQLFVLVIWKFKKWNFRWLPFTRVKSICTVRNAAIFSSSSGRFIATSSWSRWCPFHRPSFVLFVLRPCRAQEQGQPLAIFREVGKYSPCQLRPRFENLTSVWKTNSGYTYLLTFLDLTNNPGKISHFTLIKGKMSHFSYFYP